MVGTVSTNNLTRIVDDGGTWADLAGGQGGGSSTDLYISGASAHGRKIGNEVKGFNFDNVTGIDLSGGSDHVGMWINVTTYSNINTVEMVIGDGGDLDLGNSKAWNVLTGSTYPATGGWVKVFAHVDATSDGSHASGTLSLSSVRGFGAWFDHSVAAGNIYNCWIDSIEYTSGSGGLLVNGGTGGSPATFDDFNNDSTNGESVQRWGIMNEIGGIKYVNARLFIGNATATVFNDSGSVLVFSNQPYVEVDFMGITVDLQSASTDIDLTGGVIQSAATARQGDLIVSGTSGSFDMSGMSLSGLRAITLTSACTISSSTFRGCQNITHGGAAISECSFSDSPVSSGTAMLTTTNGLSSITDCSFTSGGTGHAVEITTAGTYNWDGNKNSGYGANSTDNAVIRNTSGGAVTINVINGANTPTYQNSGAGSTTTIVSGTVTVKVTVTYQGSPVQNARVLLTKDVGGATVLSGLTDSSGVIQDTGYSYSSDEAVSGWVRKSSGAPYLRQFDLAGTIASTGLSISALMTADE